jgi:hypothetical protein
MTWDFKTPVANWHGLAPGYRIAQQIAYALTGSALLVPN